MGYKFVILSLSFAFVAIKSAIFPSNAYATCYQDTIPQKIRPGCTDICSNNASGWAEGIACYSCGTDAYGSYCYYHEYSCDTGCGGTGVPGGGGGSPWECPLARVDCPVGTVRGSTIVGTQCTSWKCTNSVGSAQQTGSCCNWEPGDTICGGWYDCPTPSNPNKVCRDCEEEEDFCRQYNYDTYNCVSVCASTAPANVSFTPISLTSARLNWTPGSGGVTQYVYVGSNKSDVEANCASGTCDLKIFA